MTITTPMNQIRCLLLDVRLSGMSGLELQQTLRKKSNQVIPIVFMSGHGDEKVVATALVNGAVAFLDKPFDKKLLVDSIEKAFELHN